jgi:hypothetical protein
MKKFSLSFQVLAVIIAVTILQACASKAVTTQCAKPILRPATETGPRDAPITVSIRTETTDAYLRWTDDGTMPTCGSSGHGKLINASSGPAPTVFGRTLRAIACKAGLTPSPIAVGNYPASN